MKESLKRSRISKQRARKAVALYFVAAGLTMLGVAATPPSRTESSTTGMPQAGLYRGRPVTYTVRDGKAISEGDIILEKIDPLDMTRDSFTIAYNQYLWPKVGSQYQVPYVIQSGSGDTTNLNTAISQFNNDFTNVIQFVPRASETDYVNFYFDPTINNGQGEAIVGHAGGEQQVEGAGGSSNPCSVATILHEMGHTVGLWHEHSRPDRNSFVSVNYNNLIKGSISNFNQIFDNAQESTLFDYASIMEYPAFSFSRNGGPAIESIPAGISLSNPNNYTAADIDGIKRLYRSAPTAVTVTSNPTRITSHCRWNDGHDAPGFQLGA